MTRPAEGLRKNTGRELESGCPLSLVVPLSSRSMSVSRLWKVNKVDSSEQNCDYGLRSTVLRSLFFTHLEIQRPSLVSLFNDILNFTADCLLSNE